MPAPAVEPEAEAGETKRKRRGRRPAAALRAARLAANAAPDWLYHHLTISGPTEILEDFAAAARGAGVTPWQLDTARVEDDVFHLAVSQPARQRNLTVEGCRILARQFRERVEARQAKAAALVGQSQACPFDLHALLPVPESVLLLGPTHPEALAWLAAHWGVTDGLRQVAVRAGATTGRRQKRGHAVIGYGFFTAGETPHAAIAQLAARWPALRFVLVPRPAD
ncbi:MAG TPA: hypothetical protein VGH36_14210 [Acetobacteraceae bacterium]